MPKDIPRHIPIPIPAMLFNEFMKTTLQSIAAIIPIVTPIIILLLFMVFILLKSRLRFHFFKKFNNCYILLLNSPQSKKAEPALLRLCLSLFDYIKIVRVQIRYKITQGNVLGSLKFAPKYFGAFFVILELKG